MKFTKTCHCGAVYEGARNSRNCPSCSGYQPREFTGSKSRFRFDETSLEDRDFRSYFLGFLCTDGSVTMGKNGRFKQVGWYSSEKPHIEAIDRKLGYDHPLYKVSDKGAGEWGNSFWADNARLIESMGLSSVKSLHSLEKMDVDLEPFLRGHLDGDGTIDMRKVSAGRVVNALSFLGQGILMDQIADQIGAEVRVRERAGRVQMKVVALGSTRAEDLLGRMYEGSTIHLSRKYDLYKEALKTRGTLAHGG